MKFIKLALISAIIFSVLILGISFLLPSEINISRSIDVYASKQEVYPVVANIEQWKNWVDNKDSLTVLIYNQNKVKIYSRGGAKAWIINTDRQKVATHWQVNNGPVVAAEFNLNEHQDSTYTTLQWTFTQKVDWYPWEKFALIASEKAFGNFMESSLENLKNYIENKQTTTN